MSSVQSIYINKTEMYMQVNTYDVLHVHTLPVDAEDNEIGWIIEKPHVVSLNNNIGQLRANSVGESNVTVYVKSNPSIRATCKVYVRVRIPVESISFPVPELTMNVNNTMKLGVIVSPSNATNRKVYWSSCCSDIATVDSDGTVRPQSPGVVDIYATTEDGNLTAKCTITINEYIPVRSIRFANSELTLKQSNTKKLNAIIEPSNATYPQVIWQSCCPDIATVDSNGTIIPHSPGYVDIYATTVDGSLTTKCTVHVVIEDVTIKTVDYFTEVHFESGKIWKCINKDMIYKPENATRMLIDRSNFNLFVNPNTIPIVHEFRYYSPEEFKVLFAIDPLGVARYIEQYASFKCESLRETLQLKDEFFELFFDRKPKYFTLTNDGGWIETTDKSDPENVISESESYFGIHSIGNIDGIRILTNLVDIGTYVLSLLAKSEITEELIELGGTLIKIGLYCYDEDYASAAKELLKYAINVDSETDPDEFDIYGELLDPVFDTLALLNNMQDILDCLSEKQMYYCATIDYCVNKVNYNVKLQLQNGNVYTLASINDLII